jgi:hypothetical protein
MMTEHESRFEGSGEGGAGELLGQEEGEGAGGGPSAGNDDYSSAHDAIALDELPEPEGDPVELDDPHEAQEEAQEEAEALELEQVRAELAELAEPEGSPYDIEDDTADEDYADEADAEDYDGAEAEDYDESGEYEDEASDDSEAESDYEGTGDGE